MKFNLPLILTIAVNVRNAITMKLQIHLKQSAFIHLGQIMIIHLEQVMIIQVDQKRNAAVSKNNHMMENHVLRVA